jgi:hypothetical protein
LNVGCGGASAPLSDLCASLKLFDIVKAMKKNMGSNGKIIMIKESDLQIFKLFCYQLQLVVMKALANICMTFRSHEIRRVFPTSQTKKGASKSTYKPQYISSSNSEADFFFCPR